MKGGGRTEEPRKKRKGKRKKKRKRVMKRGRTEEANKK